MHGDVDVLIFVMALIAPYKIHATSYEETTLIDKDIFCSEDSDTDTENLVRSIPGGEEPDNEKWYGLQVDSNGIIGPGIITSDDEEEEKY